MVSMHSEEVLVVSLFTMGWKSVNIIALLLTGAKGEQWEEEKGEVNMKREREKGKQEKTFTEVVNDA